MERKMIKSNKLWMSLYKEQAMLPNSKG